MATSPSTLHTSLLRPAVIHIIRAAGFHSARASVIDTLTDLCARHLELLASNTANFVYDRSSTTLDASETLPSPPPDSPTAQNSPSSQPSHPPQPKHDDYQTPNISDIRLALSTTHFLTQTTTPTEEAWTETLRRPLSTYRPGAREKERRKRDLEDTRDVREFVEWAVGPANREIRRVAGVLPEGEGVESGGSNGPAEAANKSEKSGLVPAKDDYLTALKKKHSKTGDEARYAGTALGKGGEDRGVIRIEGGPPSLRAWSEDVGKRKAEGGVEGASGGPKRVEVG